jgi:hypothetical protein
VKFVLEKFGAAIGIANVFGSIAARNKLQSHGAALKFCLNFRDALAVRMIESFRDSQDRSEAVGEPLV